jgi:type I restriction enzyme, R subunit
VPNFISEDQIEKAILQVLVDRLGFRHVNCYTADAETLSDKSGRADKSEVVLADILKQKARELNRGIPESVIDEALELLTRQRYAISPVQANKAMYGLIRDGIPVEYDKPDGTTEHGTLKVIDFNTASSNDFLAVSQLWIRGERYFRRPDIILYVNGLPLVFIELKNSNVKLQNAYDDNLTNYKQDIPLLFQYNAICMLSNAIETKVGSFTAGWEHFFNWLRIDNEKEQIDRTEIKREGTSLERAVEGLCRKEKLLDYVENFILYHGENVKIIAQNHQFIGVNKTIASFEQRKRKQGKLGVFWHTQGAGKSFSMIFFVRKIFHKYTGNFTFVVITDRDDLDGQIYQNFLTTDTVKKNEAARPKDSKEMRAFLSRNMRIVFTLIQKFRWDKGKKYPLLSDRDDIIVIVDEAHRTQYKAFAENMRKGLPNAQYIAFTGTPLLGRERRTNAWFGNYVSEYNFKQSADDGATVPLFYEKRVPEVLIQNDDLGEEFYQILEDENLDEKQQEKLEREFAQEVEIIKRDDRLDKIARDIVAHFPWRGYLGKGMVVSVDKFTSVKMYEKVQKYWKAEIKRLVGAMSKEGVSDIEKQKLKKIREYMQSVEMAVVISAEAGEEEKFSAHELAIKPHRTKMEALDKNGHDIEYRFKDPTDRLQLVFVCAMWLTGFDVPTLSTMYLDKPMKDHTLMQAIARANRVTTYAINGVIKQNGELVDYYNVFRNMKRALADYATGSDPKKSDMPVQEKAVLFTLLDDALEQGMDFCRNIDIDLSSVITSEKTFKKIEDFNTFANRILEKDDWKKEFNVYVNTITALYEACKPEILGDTSRPLVFVFQYLRGIIDAIVQQQNIEDARRRISELLDQSVIADDEKFSSKEQREEWQIISKGRKWNLSKIDFEKLKAKFKDKKYQSIEIADLRAFLDSKLEKMLQQNCTRKDFAQKLQEIIDTYNAGGTTNENYYDELVDYTEKLHEEETRHIRENLTEDELELFDILKKEKMTKAEEKKVKLAAKALLNRLLKVRPKVLIQDWYKDAQSRMQVKSAVEEVLHENLPDSYDRTVFHQKCDNVFDLIYEYASKGVRWAA